MANAEHMNISLGKAGRKRWKGRKPHNRGTSHEPGRATRWAAAKGRSQGGRHPCSPTGVLAKGGKTRKKRKPSQRRSSAAAGRARSSTRRESDAAESRALRTESTIRLVGVRIATESTCGYWPGRGRTYNEPSANLPGNAGRSA